LAIAAVVAVAVLSGGDEDEGAARSAQEIISESRLETVLREQLVSRTSDAISDVSCDGGAQAGEEIGCDVGYDNGSSQDILVRVTGSRRSPNLSIDVP
jgi:hypothetical protein